MAERSFAIARRTPGRPVTPPTAPSFAPTFCVVEAVPVVDTVPEAEWTQVAKKRPPPTAVTRPAPSSASPANASSAQPPAPPATKSQYPKFRTSPPEGQSEYSVLSAINAQASSLRISTRQESRGSWIITPHDLSAYEWLKTKATGLTEINLLTKESWAVVQKVPIAIAPDEFLKLPQIKTATRCLSRDNTPTLQVKVTMVGPVPTEVRLGIFGKFVVRQWTPEPVRCFRCQRFGHHQAICHGLEICGVCSGHHPTSDCTTKHREGKATTAKCPNCKGSHHAWNPRCPERVKRVPAAPRARSTSVSRPNAPARRGPPPPPTRRPPPVASPRPPSAPTVIHPSMPESAVIAEVHAPPSTQWPALPGPVPTPSPPSVWAPVQPKPQRGPRCRDAPLSSGMTVLRHRAQPQPRKAPPPPSPLLTPRAPQGDSAMEQRLIDRFDRQLKVQKEALNQQLLDTIGQVKNLETKMLQVQDDVKSFLVHHLQSFAKAVVVGLGLSEAQQAELDRVQQLYLADTSLLESPVAAAPPPPLRPHVPVHPMPQPPPVSDRSRSRPRPPPQDPMDEIMEATPVPSGSSNGTSLA